jgi:ABC-type bacteriocin/lantibiotic exporter with double-glycine peptidase domain
METDELAKDAASDASMNVATKAVVASGEGVAHPAVAWPERGAITMKNLRMRYRSATPLVLKGLDVSIAGGERIGVVGRTGSGKVVAAALLDANCRTRAECNDTV